MESPGEHLKRERELRGYSLRKVFEVTRVPLKYLEAIEADDFDSLPQPTFVKGFLRAYCKFLGIDDNDSVLRYDLYLREKPGKVYELTPLPDTADKRPQSFPAHYSKWIAPGLIAAGLIAVIVIYSVSRKHAEPVQPVTQAQPVAAEENLTESPAKARIEKAGPKALATAQPDKPVAKPIATSPQGQAKTLQPTAPQRTVSVTERPALTPAVKQTAEKPALKAGHSLYVKATEDTWIKVRIDDAAEPIDVLLRTGESVSWRANSLFSIIVGNAGGVSLSLDGSPLGPLGRSGEVVSLKIPQGASVPPALINGDTTTAKPVSTQPEPVKTTKE